LHFAPAYSNLVVMTKPLALIYYSTLLPGSQLANRLYELGYRVQTLDAAGLDQLTELAEKETPICMVVEIARQSAACAAITRLKANAATAHIPVLAYAVDPDKALTAESQKAGASLLASSKAILDQIPQLLDAILQVE
jgi:DNA-binding NarL/FixJ family response regulator